MIPAPPSRVDRGILQVRLWWRRHATSVMMVAVALMIAAALWRLGNELPRLLYGADGAFDMRLRHREVGRWFAGLSVYGDVERGDYPPASYVILWPLLGWLPLALARWIWALTALAALGALGWIGVRESGARSRLQVLMVALLPFSIYASNAAIGTGQLANHVVALILVGLLLLVHGRGRWRDDILVSLLMLPALVKPTLSAPFFWIVCFRPGRLRPIVLVSLGYLALTAAAISFQDGSLASRLIGWFVEEPQALYGHTNVHKLLAVLGLQGWMLPVSLGILAVTGAWIHRNRSADPWILLGVTALVAQLWIHHRLYDHLLILIPMITLLRMSWRGVDASGSEVVPGVLFALAWVTMHAPASFLDAAPPLSVVMEVGQGVVWLTVLACLLVRARRERPADSKRTPPRRAAPVPAASRAMT